jgi:Fe-S cluster assembly protein SufD
MSLVAVKKQIASLDLLDIKKTNLIPNLAKSAEVKLNEIGFPNRKSEDWKYTKTSQLFKKPYKSGKINPNLKLDEFSFPKMKCPTLVVENGVINTHLSCVGDIDGLSINSFDNLSKEKVERIGQISNKKENPFSLLNASHLQSGFYIHLKKKNALTQPLHLIFINTESDVFSNTRVYVQIDAFAEMNLIQSFINNKHQDCVTNHVSEIELAENSQLCIDKIQNVNGESHLCSEYVRQLNSSVFRINTFSSAGKLIRNGLNIFVEGENCTTYLNGLFTPSDREHIDNHTHLEHIKPNCFSSECYKGIINDKATGVFNGKVVVHQDAQKIMAYQQNNNILLSDDAVVNAKPELEIYADDVKCSHGSTTGQIDEDALFYLQARGISKSASLQLLMVGFIDEVLQSVQLEEVKDFYSNKMESLLASN